MPSESEALDDVMDVDWNLMVNEVRVTWRQIQRTRIRNQSYKMAKEGKEYKGGRVERATADQTPLPHRHRPCCRCNGPCSRLLTRLAVGTTLTSPQPADGPRRLQPRRG